MNSLRAKGMMSFDASSAVALAISAGATPSTRDTAVEEGSPTGFAQVGDARRRQRGHQLFVRPERRGAALGSALTARAIRAGANAAPDVWICAERDARPRRLFERLGFCAVVETGVAILPPTP